MTEPSSTIDPAAILADLEVARGRRSREAYLASQTGDAAAYDAANAEVARLESAVAMAAQAGAEASRIHAERLADDRAASRKTRAAESHNAVGAAMAAAEALDHAIDMLADAWASLVTARTDNDVALLELVDDDGSNLQRVRDTMGNFESVVTTRIAALLARKGLSLPEGADVIRSADLVEGHPGRGLASVAAAVQQRLKAAHAAVRPHAPEVDFHPEFERALPVRQPERLPANLGERGIPDFAKATRVTSGQKAA